MSFKIERRAYVDMFGPTTGDRVRLADTDLIIEVVSESSRDRDYTEKRDEYWSLGVKEYWIVDTKMQHVVVLRRGKSDWIEKRLGPDDTCETKLLPGFKLACKPIFDAAAEWDEDE